MANRVTGLSGMDVEGMVQKMMVAETAKVDKLSREKTLLTWKQEAYRGFMSQMSSFQSKFLSFTSPTFNLKSDGFFKQKNFSITSANGADVKGITVKSSTNAKNVSHKIEVAKLATAAKVSGTAGDSKYPNRLTGGEINFDTLGREGEWIELDLDGVKKRVTLDDTVMSEINGKTNDADKAKVLAEHLNEKFGTAFGGSTAKVKVESSGGKLVFATEAGRTLKVSSFGNNHTSKQTFAYKPDEIADTLKFDINGKDISVSTNTDIYQIGDKTYRKNADDKLVDEKGNVIYTVKDGGNIYDKDGNDKIYTVDSEGDLYDSENNKVDNAKFLGSAKRTAAELAEAMNKELKDNGFIAETGGLIVSASGNNITFNAANDKVEYKIKETTVGETKDDGIITKGLTDIAGETERQEYKLYGKTTSTFGVTAGSTTGTTSSLLLKDVFGTNGTGAGWTIGVGENMKSLFASVEEGGLGLTAETILNEDGSVKQAASTVSDLINAVNGAGLGVKMSYNSLSGQYSIESNTMGDTSEIKLGADFAGALGLLNENGTAKDGNAVVADGNYIIKGNDAEITIDGIKTTRASNEFTLDGMTLQLDEAAVGAGAITVKSSSDMDTMVKGIKEFVSEYNKLLVSLTTSYSERRLKTASYGYYEPLTDDEKSAMSESDVKTWEDAAKKGMLSRDDLLGRAVDSLRNVMSSSIDLGNGKKMSLSDIGIASADWKDMGALSIDENKLRKALEERPDDVMLMFNKESSTAQSGNRAKRNAENGIAYLLDDVLNDAVRKSPVNGVYGYMYEKAGGETGTLVNQNYMTKKLEEINERIFNLEKANLVKESRYYSMFSKMEQAMTNAQNQLSSLGM